MHIRIDHSPRIDKWDKDCVIAFSNGKERAIIIPSTLKRECLALLLERGKTEDTAKWMILGAGIFLLIRDNLSEISQITIEQEFDRQTMCNLRNWLWWKIKKVIPNFDKENIQWLPKRMIKNKRAHRLAYGIYTERIKLKEDIRVHAVISYLSLKSEKTGGPDGLPHSRGSPPAQ